MISLTFKRLSRVLYNIIKMYVIFPSNMVQMWTFYEYDVISLHNDNTVKQNVMVIMQNAGNVSGIYKSL